MPLSLSDPATGKICHRIRRRNARAEPKTGFAPESPIRQWSDYAARAA